jgi:hypothetical protein
MRSMFLDLTSTELEVVLAQEDTTIQFTKTHIADLKAVIEADESPKASDVKTAISRSEQGACTQPSAAKAPSGE